MAVSGTNADPTYSKLPGFDVVKDTMMSRYIGNVPQVDSSGNAVSTDTHSGYRVNVKSVGVEAQFSLGEWNLTERLRYSDISGHADILDPQLNSVPSTVIAYFAPGGSLAYASGPRQGTTANLTANGGNGLLAFTTVGHTNIKSLQNVTNDFRASRVWQVAGGDLTTTAGLYKSYQDLDRDYYGSVVLQSVEGNGNSALLNLINAAGNTVTRNGVYTYEDSLNAKRRVNVTYDVLAPYASFNFHTGAIAIGGSIRYDRGRVSGTVAQAATQKMNFDVDGSGSTVGDRAEQAGIPFIAPGTSRPIDYHYDYVSYSMGINYRVAEAFSLFARHSLGGRAGADALLFSPAISATTGDLLLQSASHDKVRQTEAGFKFRKNGISLNLTGFYATTSGTYLPNLPDPVYGFKTPTLVSRSYKTYGAELEGAVRRGPFSVSGSLTLTGGEITAAETAALVGKQPRRQPTLLYTLTPQYDGDLFTIGANLLGQTSSYTDDVNRLRMPGFATVGLFAQVRPIDRLVLGVNVSNLFDKTAIMEANSAAIPTSGVATVRTLYGRLVSASARFFF
jgi:outer membrane receptor protein involved in Fe transport